MADDKKFPKSSPGIAGLLNIKPDENPAPPPTIEQTSSQNYEEVTPYEAAYEEKKAQAPSNLPTSEDAELFRTVEPAEPPLPIMEQVEPVIEEVEAEVVEPVDLEAMALANHPAQENRTWRLAKTFLPYVVIFAIAVGMYFFYFSDFSFNSLFSGSSLKIESVGNEQVNKNLEQLKQDVKGDYRKWINQFFADVNDESIIAMDADVSGNGLSNLEKYLLNLNPKVYSTRGNMGDGQAVLEGINPWTGKPFTEKQKQLIQKYINPELISNRITAAALTRGVTKYALYVNEDSPYYIDPATLARVGTGSGNIVVDPTKIELSPGSGSNLPTPTATPPSGNNSTGSGEESFRSEESIDTSKPGLLDIPANKISVPLIWTKDVKDFEKDLKRGVVHYPGTALPGEIGTSYISGHSSGYLWDKSPYKQIFAGLGSVADGTSFTISATQKSGKPVKFNYVVARRGEYAANDQAQFMGTSDSLVALSTCWPVGTVDRRLVLFGKLTQTER